MKYDGFALITGASRGLGMAFARALAERHCNLVLVARSAEPLPALANELRRSRWVSVVAIQVDLSFPGAVQIPTEQLSNDKIPIDLIVNNAGFGLCGEFRGLSIRRQLQMLRLNNQAILELTYRLLPRLLERRQKGIINISSTAGFQPVPFASVYSTTKAFLTAFSLALEQELRSAGVSVVTVCPGRLRKRSHRTSALGVDTQLWSTFPYFSECAGGDNRQRSNLGESESEAPRLRRISMTDQHGFISADQFHPDPYIQSRTAERTLNAALVQAEISRSYEEYLEIFDEFYADDIEGSSETMEEPLRGKERVRSLLFSFLAPSPACPGRGRWGVDIHSRNGDSWRCYRRDPFCVDTGVGRGVRQNLYCELAHLAEMERIACSAGASLRLPAKR
jgi:short-subunit dehydrogenase